jgi:hypothetical protein
MTLHLAPRRAARAAAVSSLLVVGLMTAASPAVAQPPPPPPPQPQALPPLPPAGVPPDVVRLKDGSMYRGTIVELVAKDHVSVTLANGESRSFPMRDVAYAGPGAQSGAEGPAPVAPGPAPFPRRPPAAREGGEGEQPVHLEASEKNLQFLVRVGQAETTGAGYAFGRYGGPVFYAGHTVAYSNLCAPPCDATLPAGSHHLALSQDGGKAIEADEPVEISGPTTLRGTYESRRGIRIGGLLIVLGSVIGGTALMVSGIHPTTCDDNGCSGGLDQGAVWGGVAVMGVGTLVGTIMMLVRDTATIETVRGGDARALRLPGLGAALEGADIGPEALPGGAGLALRLRM